MCSERVGIEIKLVTGQQTASKNYLNTFLRASSFSKTCHHTREKTNQHTERENLTPAAKQLIVVFTNNENQRRKLMDQRTCMYIMLN